MAGKTKNSGLREQPMPAFIVELEYEPTDDAEERLLRVFEFLLEGPAAQK